MKINRTFAKIAEIFFASGIPIIALADSSQNKANFFAALPLLTSIIFIGGWHVKTFNDDCEDGKKLSLSALFPLIVIPLFLYLRPLTGMLLIFIFINWDIYSLKGKNNYIISLIANFLGGFLHFLLGASCSNGNFLDFSFYKALFFAFAMLCGSMHHDAYHAEEDKLRSYCTGAVKFGANYWWRLAIFPMIFTLFFLPHSEAIFTKPFLLFALIPYFVSYFIIFTAVKNPHKFLLFRIVCRIFFALAALIFIIQHLQNSRIW